MAFVHWVQIAKTANVKFSMAMVALPITNAIGTSVLQFTVTQDSKANHRWLSAYAPTQLSTCFLNIDSVVVPEINVIQAAAMDIAKRFASPVWVAHLNLARGMFTNHMISIILFSLQISLAWMASLLSQPDQTLLWLLRRTASVASRPTEFASPLMMQWSALSVFGQAVATQTATARWWVTQFVHRSQRLRGPLLLQ